MHCTFLIQILMTRHILKVFFLVSVSFVVNSARTLACLAFVFQQISWIKSKFVLIYIQTTFNSWPLNEVFKCQFQSVVCFYTCTALLEQVLTTSLDQAAGNFWYFLTFRSQGKPWNTVCLLTSLSTHGLHFSVFVCAQTWLHNCLSENASSLYFKVQFFIIFFNFHWAWRSINVIVTSH